MSARSPIPVGLIGAGKHGERYLRHLVSEVPELRLRLLCRRDAEAGRPQADSAGARFVADFRELASSPEIEAVIVVVPPALHPEICAIAARSGKAILIEKPLAVSVAEGKRIRADVTRAGVSLMVAQTLRFNHVVRTVAANLERIAPVTQFCLSQRFEPSRLAWLDDPAQSGGGIILHTGVHGFDLVRFLTGRSPVSASAIAARVATRRTEDNFAALFAFEGAPLTASVAGSRSTASRSGAIEVSGERGQILADHVHGVAVRIEGMRRIPLDVGPEMPTVRETARAFARALRDGTSMPVTLEDGLRAVAMAEACYRSLASGGSAVRLESSSACA